MHAIEIYKCNGCGVMNVSDDPSGDVSRDKCKNCGETSITWFAATEVQNANEMSLAMCAIESDVIRPSREVTELYEEADGQGGMFDYNQGVVDTLCWLTDPDATRPEIESPYSDEDEEDPDDDEGYEDGDSKNYGPLCYL